MLKILLWFPRILAILAILFMMMFSLDVFVGEDSIGKKLIGFLVHNIPAFVLIAALVIAWKNEIIGGLIFILLSLALAIFFNSFSGNSGSLVILVPILITGALFILHHVLSGREDRG